MEAVKAFDEGKTIYSKTKGRKYFFGEYKCEDCDGHSYIVDVNGNPITAHEILNLEWYIEEEE